MGGLHADTHSALVTTAGWRWHAGCHLVGKKRKSGKTGMGKYVSICPWCKGREWREVVKSQKSLISGRKCCSSHMFINPLHSGVPQSAPSKAGSSWTVSASDHHRLNPNSIFPSDFMSCLWLVVRLLIVFTHLKGWIFYWRVFHKGSTSSCQRPALTCALFSLLFHHASEESPRVLGTEITAWVWEPLATFVVWEMTCNHSLREKRGFEDRLSWIEGQVLNSLSLSFGKKNN